MQAAGAIHGDFERGFICAEVMKYEELKELGNESAVKVRRSSLHGNCPACAHLTPVRPPRLRFAASLVAGCLSALRCRAAQAAGKYRQEGKNYTVNDGDVRIFLQLVS